MDSIGGGNEEGKGRFGAQKEREREKQRDVWPQTQLVEGERKCKGEDERAKS